MAARSFGLMICFWFAGIGLAISGMNESPVIVDLRAHRGEIRTELLKHTPLGASVKVVTGFISKQLQREGSAAPVTVEPVKDNSQPRAAKVIRVYLGQYYDHPEVVFFSAPMMMQKEVTAKWLFDSQDRLIDIALEKQEELY